MGIYFLTINHPIQIFFKVSFSGFVDAPVMCIQFILIHRNVAPPAKIPHHRSPSYKFLTWCSIEQMKIDITYTYMEQIVAYMLPTPFVRFKRPHYLIGLNKEPSQTNSSFITQWDLTTVLSIYMLLYHGSKSSLYSHTCLKMPPN